MKPTVVTLLIFGHGLTYLGFALATAGWGPWVEGVLFTARIAIDAQIVWAVKARI